MPWVTFESACAKTLGFMLPLPSALTSAHPSAHLTAFGSGLRASWGLTLTRSAPKGPFPRGLALQSWVLGTAKPERQTHPVSRPPHGCIRAPPLIQDGRRAEPSETPGTFEGTRAKTLVPVLPLHSALSSAHLTAHHRAFGSVLLASWGLTLTQGRPP